VFVYINIFGNTVDICYCFCYHLLLLVLISTNKFQFHYAPAFHRMHSEYLLILPQKYTPFYTKINNELKNNPLEVFRNGETIKKVAKHIVKRPYPVLPLVCSLDNKDFQELCIQQAWGLMNSDWDLEKLLIFVVFTGELGFR
uniref:Uncharacterized protein n=1 Tax=Megaselia scalaris TaxID=36166 RepID=T1GPC0_MEGSC